MPTAAAAARVREPHTELAKVAAADLIGACELEEQQRVFGLAGQEVEAGVCTMLPSMTFRMDVADHLQPTAVREREQSLLEPKFYFVSAGLKSSRFRHQIAKPWR